MRARIPSMLWRSIAYLQVNILSFQLADILEAEEDWSDAAKVLMGISLDSGQRYVLFCQLWRILQTTTAGHYPTRASCVYTFVSSVYCSKMKTPFRQSDSATAPHSSPTPRPTRRSSSRSNSVKPASATTPAYSSRPRADTTSSAGSAKSTRASDCTCCTPLASLSARKPPLMRRAPSGPPR